MVMALPRWKGALLRGGLGHTLQSAMCECACSDPGSCSRSEPCPYRAIFAPDAEEGSSNQYMLLT